EPLVVYFESVVAHHALRQRTAGPEQPQHGRSDEEEHHDEADPLRLPGKLLKHGVLADFQPVALRGAHGSALRIASRSPAGRPLRPYGSAEIGGSFCFRSSTGAKRSPSSSARCRTSSATNDRRFRRLTASSTSSHITGVETVGCSF